MKKVKTILLVFMVAVLLVAGNYYYDLSFNGNETVQIIPNSEKIMSLEEIANNENFKNSVLYLDVWGTRCSPCIAEFQNVPDLKEHYKDKNVKFIYLSSPYGTFSDEQKWKSMIKKFNLAGYHVNMSIEFYNNLWKYENIKDPFAIPHYILIDHKGKIAEINAPRPSQKEELFNQIDRLLANTEGLK